MRLKETFFRKKHFTTIFFSIKSLFLEYQIYRPFSMLIFFLFSFICCKHLQVAVKKLPFTQGNDKDFGVIIFPFLMQIFNNWLLFI